MADLADLLVEYQTYLIGEFRDDLDGLEDAPRYDIEIRISDDIDDISGLMEVEYTNRQGEALQEVYFRLFPNMSGDHLRVDNVRVNGETAFSEAAYLNTALRVRLDDALQPGMALPAVRRTPPTLAALPDRQSAVLVVAAATTTDPQTGQSGSVVHFFTIMTTYSMKPQIPRQARNDNSVAVIPSLSRDLLIH